jgi:tripartite-type tricarboxylate transporter receptor subunit TctC
LVLACGAALLTPIVASAQAYPTRPITLVVGYAAGGPTDVIARIIAQDMAASLGQSVVVLNKPGANSLIASQMVARAAPDGYTLLAASHSHSVNPLLLENARYDPIQDFTPVSLVAVLPLVLVTQPDAPFGSVQDLVNAATARPGEVTYASAGHGGSAHLAGALLATLAGVQMTHVPFSGNAPALLEVMAGRVSFMFYPMLGVASNVSHGRLKVLAVGADRRHPDFPSVPTMAEAGFRGFHETAPWVGILAPAGTTAPLVQRLNEAVRGALAKPQTQQRLRELGANTVDTSRGEFAAFLQKDSERWARVIRAAGVERQ